MTVRELLAASSADHRRAVAAGLGAGDENVAALARLLEDEARLEELVAALPAEARAAATMLAFASPVFTGPGHVQRTAALELERRGIAFAFGDRWSRHYVVPSNLSAPLRRVRSAAHARRMPPADAVAERWVGAPAQTVHDAAALWAFLARTPARVKADGELYARAWPKLTGALPPIVGIDAAGFDTMRVDLALDLLREDGFVRLRVADRPGHEVRRELAAEGDLPVALERDAATLPGRLHTCARRGPIHAVADALGGALEGRAVELGALGEAVRRVIDEAGLPDRAGQDDVTRALSAVGPLWLAGMLELGVDGAGEPVAARFAPDGLPEAEGPLGICQSTFEVVCLRPPAAAERAMLELVAEAVPDQAHVFRLTRGSARCAERLLGPGGARAALDRLTGALPQNVDRSLADWVGDVRPPLRMRSAIFLDAGDAATADALAGGPLAGLVTDRLSERLLAVHGRQVADVERALAAAGHELEPGLDRVSGTWLERPDGSAEARARWAAGDPYAEEARRPLHKLVSTLGGSEAPSTNGRLAALSPELESLSVIVHALEEESDVEILYAGKRGLTQRRITPLEIEGEALHAWCHLRDDERSFWMASIRSAEVAAG